MAAQKEYLRAEHTFVDYDERLNAMTEDSVALHTSKCDHLALETMEHHEQYLGKRTKRGLFKSSTGKLMNADCNGAVGILRKANVIQDSALSRLLDRGDVVSPCVLNVRGFNRRLGASTNV